MPIIRIPESRLGQAQQPLSLPDEQRTEFITSGETQRGLSQLARTFEQETQGVVKQLQEDRQNEINTQVKLFETRAQAAYQQALSDEADLSDEMFATEEGRERLRTQAFQTWNQQVDLAFQAMDAPARALVAPQMEALRLGVNTEYELQATNRRRRGMAAITKRNLQTDLNMVGTPQETVSMLGRIGEYLPYHSKDERSDARLAVTVAGFTQSFNAALAEGGERALGYEALVLGHKTDPVLSKEEHAAAKKLFDGLPVSVQTQFKNAARDRVNVRTLLEGQHSTEILLATPDIDAADALAFFDAKTGPSAGLADANTKTKLETQRVRLQRSLEKKAQTRLRSGGGMVSPDGGKKHRSAIWAGQGSQIMSYFESHAHLTSPDGPPSPPEIRRSGAVAAARRAIGGGRGRAPEELISELSARLMPTGDAFSAETMKEAYEFIRDVADGGWVNVDEAFKGLSPAVLGAIKRLDSMAGGGGASGRTLTLEEFAMVGESIGKLGDQDDPDSRYNQLQRQWIEKVGARDTVGTADASEFLQEASDTDWWFDSWSVSDEEAATRQRVQQQVYQVGLQHYLASDGLSITQALSSAATAVSLGRWTPLVDAGSHGHPGPVTQTMILEPTLEYPEIHPDRLRLDFQQTIEDNARDRDPAGVESSWYAKAEDTRLVPFRSVSGRTHYRWESQNPQTGQWELVNNKDGVPAVWIPGSTFTTDEGKDLAYTLRSAAKLYEKAARGEKFTMADQVKHGSQTGSFLRDVFDGYDEAFMDPTRKPEWGEEHRRYAKTLGTLDRDKAAHIAKVMLETAKSVENRSLTTFEEVDRRMDDKIGIFVREREPTDADKIGLIDAADYKISTRLGMSDREILEGGDWVDSPGVQYAWNALGDMWDELYNSTVNHAKVGAMVGKTGAKAGLKAVDQFATRQLAPHAADIAIGVSEFQRGARLTAADTAAHVARAMVNTPQPFSSPTEFVEFVLDLNKARKAAGRGVGKTVLKGAQRMKKVGTDAYDRSLLRFFVPPLRKIAIDRAMQASQLIAQQRRAIENPYGEGKHPGWGYDLRAPLEAPERSTRSRTVEQLMGPKLKERGTVTPLTRDRTTFRTRR